MLCLVILLHREDLKISRTKVLDKTRRTTDGLVNYNRMKQGQLAMMENQKLRTCASVTRINLAVTSLDKDSPKKVAIARVTVRNGKKADSLCRTFF